MSPAFTNYKVLLEVLTDLKRIVPYGIIFFKLSLDLVMLVGIQSLFEKEKETWKIPHLLCAKDSVFGF